MTFLTRTAGGLTLCLLSASLALAQDPSVSLQDPSPPLQDHHSTRDAPRGLRGAIEGEASGEVDAWRSEVRENLSTSRAESPPAEETEAQPNLRGRLIAVGKKALREVLEKGASVSESFDLTDFIHVGLRQKVYLVKESSLVPEQKKALGQNPRHVWIATEVEGGIRLPFVTVIPLGEANVQVGMTPGAVLNYKVVDLYPLPEGITDGKTVVKNLDTLGRRAFDLPLTAAEALAQPMGAQREFRGNLSVAIAGSMGVGYDLADLGEFMQLGASARVGGFYRITDSLVVEVLRLEGDAVRLRLRDGRDHRLSADAKIVVGASVDRGALTEEITSAEYLEPIVNVGTGVARRWIEDVVRFQIKAEVWKDRGNELDISYRFDLSKASAQRAYERAMRGDFTRAADMARLPDSGVLEEYRVFDIEDRTYSEFELELSLIFALSASRSISMKELLVRDPDGTHRYEVFRFDREKRVSLFDRRWKKNMHVEVLGEVEEGLSHLTDRSLRFTYRIRDAYTRISEVRELRRALAAWGLPGTDEESMPTPKRRFLNSRYGETRTALALDISEAGVEALLAKGEDAFHAAYVEAVVAVGDRRPSGGDLRRAHSFAEGLASMSNQHTRKDRGKRLAALAKGAKWDMFVITALVKLAPPESVRIQASILGNRVSFDALHRGAGFDDSQPKFYGH